MKNLPKIISVDFFHCWGILSKIVGISIKIKGVIMQEDLKSLKQYCREAKKRLKNGFWQNYHQNLKNELDRAEKAGVAASKVKEYYVSKVSDDIKNVSEEKEEFYKKVKKILIEEGEISNAIGRLTDTEYYKTLSYDEQQRYTLSLSEKYLQAVERFRKEKAIEYKS